MDKMIAVISQMPQPKQGTHFQKVNVNGDDSKAIVHFSLTSPFYTRIWEQVRNLYANDQDAAQRLFLKECKAEVARRWPDYSLVHFEEIAKREENDRQLAGLYLFIQRGDADLQFESSNKQLGHGI